MSIPRSLSIAMASALLLCFFVVDPISAEDWQARWIGPAVSAENNRRNSWYCFRKTLVADSVPPTFLAKIACDSKYWLWVNGDLVVFEGGLKRGPTPHGTYFDQVDLAPFFKLGDNSIAVLVWHFGKHGFSHNDSGQVGLIVDGSGGNLSLRTDETWRVIRHPAYEDADNPPPNYRLAEGNIRFDARQDLMDWQTSGISESWSEATILGKAIGQPWGELVERAIPHWKDYGIRDYVSIAETTADKLGNISKPKNEAVDTRRVLIGSLPYNAHIHPRLSITAPPGLRIDLQTDVSVIGGEQCLRAEYITRDGRQEFELPGWLNGHEVRYFLPDEVQVESIQYRETGYDAEFVGKFHCDNARLNKLWEKSRRTLYVTMRDSYMDCPERERAQWWGDAVLEIGEAFYVFDPTNGPQLARKAIRELAAFQRSDKTLYSPVPSGVPPNDQRKNLYDGSWNTELPRQMLASVGYCGFWNYYRFSRDEVTIRQVYPNVRDYLSVWELNESGLVKHRTGEWDWTDWGENMDVSVLENAWYHLALRAR